jgi:hypothetical protein
MKNKVKALDGSSVKLPLSLESQHDKTHSTMKACFYAKYGKPSVLQIGDLPRANLIAPNEVLVQVYAASINPVRDMSLVINCYQV